MLATLLAALTALLLIAALIDTVAGLRRLPLLKTVRPARLGPRVSILVAARNEARNIEHALTTVLDLDYPDCEIIVIDDRSTDQTSEILARLTRSHPRLNVVHVATLPEGWLGKNYALYTGALQASGTLLLFTDADVTFEPTALRRAVALLEREGIDHLAVIPEVCVDGTALNALVAAFGLYFSLYARPWKARDVASRSHIGIGAFNLMRAETYRAIGTHQMIAMRPDDDLKLGKLVKRHGFRQDVAYGRGLVAVEWYASVRELVQGLMKNAFAGVNYSLWAVMGATIGLVITNIWPFVALLTTHGLARSLSVVNIAALFLLFTAHARKSGVRLRYALTLPAAALFFAYILWRAAVLALVRGTVTWRGTAYPLSQMRANRV